MFQNIKRFPAFIDREGKKIPIYDDWKTIATNDPQKLSEWYNKHAGPNFIWGVPCGEDNGIFALDIDVKKGRDGFETLKRHGLVLPNTAAQKTLSGGYHLIFKYPKGLGLGNRASIIEDSSGIDTRGEGGWIVDYGFTQSQQTPIEPPQWLVESAKKKVIEQPVGGSQYKLSPEVAQSMIAELLHKIKTAPAGTGNQTLNDCAFEMGRIVTTGAIDLQEARKLLIEAAMHNGRRGEYESTATTDSGLEGGLKAPYVCPFETSPKLLIPILEPIEQDWTPPEITFEQLTDWSKLKQPQLYKDWSSQDIMLLNASGGTGKTTLLLYEAVCMRLGDRFLGFECLRPNGKTLYLTGEDTVEKIISRLGKILEQMDILNDKEKIEHIKKGIFIKKDDDMCIVVRDKQGVWHPNPDAYKKISQAISKIKPDKVVIDPLASFWGPESQLNDMARGVIRFVGKLVNEFGIAVEMVHHLSSDGDKSKEMGQFSGRGGSVIPSHSRVVKSMRLITDDEKDEFINFRMEHNESAILCNVGKFTDGSELLHKPFIIVRNGFLFRKELIGKKVQTVQKAGPLCEKEIMSWLLEERKKGRYPNKTIIKSKFSNIFTNDQINNTISTLLYFGFEGYKISLIEDPTNLESKTKVYTVYKDGVEVVNE